MSEGGGARFTEADFHSIQNDGSAGESLYEGVIRTLAKYRPNISATELTERRKALAHKKYAHESWGYSVGRDIEPGEKKFSDNLDLEPLVIAGVLCSEEWQKTLLERHAQEGISSLAELQLALSKNRFESEAAKTIDHLTEVQLQKIERAPHGKLTHGLELEVETTGKGWATYRQQRDIERLQDLGLEVTYDGLREIVLGKSLSVKEQMKAVESILKMGLVTSDQSLSVHYTIGGFSEFNTEFFVLDQILEASGIGRDRQRPGERLMVENNPSGNKPIYEDIEGSPSGLPFKVRKRPSEEGTVVEFRWAGEFKEFSKMVKYIETTAYLAEAMEQWIMRKNNIPGYKPELADAWDVLKAQVNEVFMEAQLPALTESLEEFTKDKSSAVNDLDFPEAVNYSKRLSAIVNRTHLSARHTDLEMRARNSHLQASYEKITNRQRIVKTAVLETRKKVREAFSA